MGNFLGLLKSSKEDVELNNLGCSLVKLRQYYVSYRMLCQDFTIDSMQYSQIFGSNVNSFNVWDCNHVGKVDALEMFSGLVLFSNAHFEEKMQFLFEMFDLNEEGTLGYEAMHFMLVNCCNATYKIRRIGKQMSDEEVESFLGQYFYSESEVSLKRLISWTSQIDEIRSLFELIRKQLPSQKVRQCQYVIPAKLYSSERRTEFTPKIWGRPNSQLKKLETAKQLAYSIQPLYNQQQFNPRLKWVYGIRTEDVSFPVHCITGCADRAANEKLLYFVGRVAIVYFPKLSMQQWYTEHEWEISCLTVSKGGQLAATGEMATKPSIHIWDTKSLTKLKILKDRHRQPISHLLFFKNDRLLVSTSHSPQDKSNPTLFVHSIETDTVLFSCLLTERVVRILPSTSNHPDVSSSLSTSNTPSELSNISSFEEESFLVVCRMSVSLFTMNNTSFTKTFHTLVDQQISSVILSSGVIITGHRGGRVVKWTKMSQSTPLFSHPNFQTQVLSICQTDIPNQYLVLYGNAIILLTEGTHIQVAIPNVGLSMLQMLHISVKKYLIVGLMGQLIEAYLEDDLQFCRLNSCFKLEDVTASVLEDGKLYVATKGIVYKIENNELVNVYPFERDIACMSVHKGRIAIGLKTGELMIGSEKYNGLPMVDILLTQQCLIVLTTNTVEMYSLSLDRFFSKAPKKITIQNVQITGFIRTPRDRMVYVETKGGTIIRLDMELKYSLLSSDEKLPIDHVELVDEYTRLYLSGMPGLSVLADSHGNLQLWPSYQEFLKKESYRHQLKCHASAIQNMIVATASEDKYQFSEEATRCLYSVGLSDQMICIWEDQQVFKETDELHENIGSLAMETKQIRMEEVKLFKRRTQLADSQIRVRNNVDRVLDKVISEIVQEKGVSSNNIGNGIKYRLPPASSLKISYVFGFESARVRNSLAYCHVYYQCKGKTVAKKIVRGSRTGQSNIQTLQPNEETKKELEYCQQMLLPYCQTHGNCKKYYVYFSQRICVRFCPETKQQRFYDQHQQTITCLAVHPNKNIVCSCSSEISLSQDSTITASELRLWDCKTFETKRVTRLPHPGHVKTIVFSKDGGHLACISQDNSAYNIDVYDWQNDSWIGHRCLGTLQVIDLKFDPYKSKEIAIGGLNHLGLYTISTGSLLLKQQAVHEKPQTILCVDFVSNSYGKHIESDVLCGNDQGDIGLLICGKYLHVRVSAHLGRINCLKVGELFGNKVVLVTAGEDEMVRIWDTKMNSIAQINLRSLFVYSNLASDCDCSPQSIDLYHCSEQDNTGDVPSLLLVGTRNGDILEASIESDYRGLKFYVEESKIREERKDNSVKQESLKLKWTMPMRGFPSSHPVKFTIFKNKMILYSQTNSAFLWDLSSRQLVQELRLPSGPSCATFSQEGQLLVFGMISGELIFFQVSGFTFRQIHQTASPHNTILAVQFSESSSRLAVSYVPIKGGKDRQPYVTIYKLRVVTQNLLTQNVPKDPEKLAKICDLESRQINTTQAACRMTFSTSPNENFILVWYDAAGRLIPGEEKVGRYQLWDIERKQPRKSFEFVEFSNMNFSSIVTAQYRYEIDPENKQVEHDRHSEVQITNMTQASDNLVLSTENGELALLRANCFYTQNQNSKPIWSLSKTYKAHAGSINTVCQGSPNEIYTGCDGSSTVIKWQLTVENNNWDVDAPNDYQEKYQENLSNKQLEELNNKFTKRKMISELSSCCDKKVQIPLTIRLSNMIGRSARHKRNNLLYDNNDRLIGFAGCNITMLQKHQNGYKQQFVKIDENYPEISAITMSYDRRLLVVGTSSQAAKIIVWDIGSRTTIYDLMLHDVVEVRHVQMSRKDSDIVVLGLNKHNKLQLIYIREQKVIAVHKYEASPNIKIHSLLFLPTESNVFITCGYHHIAQWRENCGLLNYELYKLDDGNSEREFINFYCSAFVKDSIVTGCQDGFLYVWEAKRIVKRQEAHPGEAVLALHCSPNSKIFASGGSDGKVVLWQLTSNVLQKLYEQKVYQGPLLSHSPLIKHHVQSITIGSDRIIVGTRNGDIYEFDRPAQGESMEQQQQSGRLVLPAFDHQQIIQVKFGASSKDIYVLTKAGTLAIIETEGLRKTHEAIIELHNKTLLRMFICQVSQMIILVYSDEVQLFDSLRRRGEMARVASYRFNKICNACLSPNQRYLAVLLSASQSQNSKLLLYELKIGQRRENELVNMPQDTFTHYQSLENLSSEVSFIDFSTDNQYLAYRLKDDSENVIIKMATKERMNKLCTDHEIQWSADGKKTMECIRSVLTHYNEDNQLFGMAQLMNKCVVATDEVGTLRLFQYPLTQERGYTECLVEHMCDITICVASPDCRKLITYSRMDRCLNLWRVEKTN